MQLNILTVGLFATLAAASSHRRHPHFNFRRQNTTSLVQSAAVDPSATALVSTAPIASSAGSPGEADLTTLTVVTTSVHTVISCAPTITNCPAASDTAALSSLPSGAHSTVLVTDTIVLTSTVCPVSDATSISKEVISKAQTGGITGSTLTSAQPTAAQTTTIISEVDVPTETVITMTLGNPGAGGQGSREVTTTIKTTMKSTVTRTTVIPKPSETSKNSGSGSNSGNSGKGKDNGQTGNSGNGGNGGNGGNAGNEEATTRVTMTTYATQTVTVKNTATAKPIGGGSSGSGSGSGDCQCPAAETVTVTKAAETVYVTMTAPGAAAEQTKTPGGGKNQNTDDGKSGSGKDNSGSGKDNSGAGKGSQSDKPGNAGNAAQPTTTSPPEAGESECPPEVVVTSTVVPFPSNGTDSGAAQATGTGVPVAAQRRAADKAHLVY